jgi:site-specific DNA-methyltransferase (cytosine-N4-specific)
VSRKPAIQHTLLGPKPEDHSSNLLSGIEPAYRTQFGAAYLGDALELMRQMPAQSVQLVVTSPPYALHFKKEYGNAEKDAYVRWFFPSRSRSGAL